MDGVIPELSSRANALVMSYVGIRRAIGISGLLLPIVLCLGGLAIGVPIQDNISSYYHTPLRDIFVGTMSAIGVFLMSYRGHDRAESWTANIGCVAALGVALCPLDADSDPLFQKSLTGYLHTVFGGVFFVTLAFYSLVHFPRSSGKDGDDEPHVWERNAIYRSSGLIILTSLMFMCGYLFFLPHHWKRLANDWNFLFIMETIATWSFAVAWLTKGRMIVADIAVDLLAIPTEVIKSRIRKKC